MPAYACLVNDSLVGYGERGAKENESADVVFASDCLEVRDELLLRVCESCAKYESVVWVSHMKMQK